VPLEKNQFFSSQYSVSIILEKIWKHSPPSYNNRR